MSSSAIVLIWLNKVDDDELNRRNYLNYNPLNLSKSIRSNDQWLSEKTFKNLYEHMKKDHKSVVDNSLDKNKLLFEEKINLFQSEFSEFKTTISNLVKSEMDTVNRNHDDLLIKLNNISKDKDGLNSKLKKANKSILNLKTEINMISKSYTDLENQLNIDLLNHKNKNNQLKLKIAELEKTSSWLTSKIDNLTNNYNDSSTKLEINLNSLTDKISKWNIEISTIQNDIESYVEKINSFSDKIDQTNNKISEGILIVSILQLFVPLVFLNLYKFVYNGESHIEIKFEREREYVVLSFI